MNYSPEKEKRFTINCEEKYFAFFEQVTSIEMQINQPLTV